MTDASDLAMLEHTLLDQGATFGFGTQAIGYLLQTAQICDWTGDEPSVPIGEAMPQVHLLIGGAGVVEVRPNPNLRARSDPTPGILKLLAPGEIFCVPPSPRSGDYTVVARSHATSAGDAVARGVTWTSDAMRSLAKLLGPEGNFTLLTTGWRFLSRVAEEMAVLLALDVKDRFRFMLPRLARRFPRQHPEGTLIDLKLPDAFLARLVCAHRCTVNRAIWQLDRHGELRRLDDLILLPFNQSKEGQS